MFKKEDIKIKKYLGLAEKSIIVDSMLDSCFADATTDSGLTEIDFVVKELNMAMSVVIKYTDLELIDDSVVEQYDELMESGTLQYIIDTIGEDYWILCDMVDNAIEQRIELNNSMPSILKKIAEDLIAKVPDEAAMKDIIDSVAKAVGEFDTSKLEIIGKNVVDSIVSK